VVVTRLYPKNTTKMHVIRMGNIEKLDFYFLYPIDMYSLFLFQFLITLFCLFKRKYQIKAINQGETIYPITTPVKCVQGNGINFRYKKATKQIIEIKIEWHARPSNIMLYHIMM
jgi:hypothetical protein